MSVFYDENCINEFFPSAREIDKDASIVQYEREIEDGLHLGLYVSPFDQFACVDIKDKVQGGTLSEVAVEALDRIVCDGSSLRFYKIDSEKVALEVQIEPNVAIKCKAMPQYFEKSPWVLEEEKKISEKTKYEEYQLLELADDFRELEREEKEYLFSIRKPLSLSLRLSPKKKVATVQLLDENKNIPLLNILIESIETIKNQEGKLEFYDDENPNPMFVLQIKPHVSLVCYAC